MSGLKFRAWHKILRNYAHIKRIWLDGDGDGHDEIFAVSDAETTYPIHEVVLEQYTGLKDKNGKEIYEGDIVQESNYKTVVEFSTEDVGSCGCCVDRFWGSGFIVTISDNPEDCEVIGNIHENPELLEEK